MRRREFIGVLGSLVAWSVPARAQQRAIPVIGFLSGASFETMREWVAAFHRGLADAGFAEDRNVVIEYRWAQGNNDRLPELAMALVRRNVDIIVVVASTPGALAAKAATQAIPIIFFIGTDPGQFHNTGECSRIRPIMFCSFKTLCRPVFQLPVGCTLHNVQYIICSEQGIRFLFLCES